MSERKHAEDEHNGPRQLTTVTLTSEQFESLYLQPRSSAGSKNRLVGNLGNPTPIGITSFLLCLLPMSMDFMDFRGTTFASSITVLGAFYGVGGIGLYLACIMEWIIGNTFPSVVFAAFGGFFIAYGILIQPSFDVSASFATAEQATSSATAAAAGAATVGYNSGLGLYFLTWGLVCVVLLVASLRTNIAFAGIFLFLIVAFELIAAAYFHISNGNVPLALKELKAAGAFAFVISLFLIWIDASLLFAAVGMPFRVPLGDLSGHGAHDKDEQGAAQA